MTLLQDRPHIRSHRMIPRNWGDEKARPITDSDIRRAKHRADNLTKDTREISRRPGWVPGWEKMRGQEGQVLPPGVSVPQFIPDKRSRWRKFKDRFVALWDWFVLSVVGTIFTFVLLAGGLMAAKVLVIVYMSLFNGNA